MPSHTNIYFHTPDHNGCVSVPGQWISSRTKISIPSKTFPGTEYCWREYTMSTTVLVWLEASDNTPLCVSALVPSHERKGQDIQWRLVPCILFAPHCISTWQPTWRQLASSSGKMKHRASSGDSDTPVTSYIRSDLSPTWHRRRNCCLQDCHPATFPSPFSSMVCNGM